MPGKKFMGQSLPNLLKHYEDFGGVAVAWLRFGTSGHARPPAQLVTEAYMRRRATADANFKHIVQPRRLRGFMNIHEMFYYDGYMSVDEHKRPVMHFTNKEVAKSFDVVRLHHYFTRSCFDWWIRVNHRGSVSGGLSKYNFSDLKRLDSNDISDPAAANLAAQLKSKLRWDGESWQQKYFPESSSSPPECRKHFLWKSKS